MYIYAYKDLAALNDTQVLLDNKWVAARPLQWQGMWNIFYRFYAAWAVFRGRADAFTWPGGQV